MFYFQTYLWEDVHFDYIYMYIHVLTALKPPTRKTHPEVLPLRRSATRMCVEPAFVLQCIAMGNVSLETKCGNTEMWF